MSVDSPSRLEKGPIQGGSGVAEPGIAAIDKSCRDPVLFLLCGALIWLGIGTLLLLLSSVQLFWSSLLDQFSWSQFGRVRPAGEAALLYGFAVQAGLAVTLWLTSRLGRSVLQGGFYIILGAAFWNIGVTAGFFGILAGHNTGFEWLEVPPYASVVLFFSYALIGVGILLNFAVRPRKEMYISHWFLLGALVWFAWIFSTAQLLLVYFPIRGALQGVVNLWYINNLTELWMSATGLGILFYMIPKLLARPMENYQLAVLGFVSLALFGSWAGIHAGLPVPKWIPTISIVATVFLLIPLIAFALNFHWTIGSQYTELRRNPFFRFMVFGLVCYMLATLLKVAGALRSVSEVTQFTLFTQAVTVLHLYGFFAMTVAGIFYYMVQRLLQCDTVPARYVELHFILAAVGVLLFTAAYTMGGVLQGVAVNLSPDVPLGDAVRIALPFLVAGSAGLLLILGAQLVFIGNVFLMMGSSARVCCPGLFRFEREKAQTVGGEA